MDSKSFGLVDTPQKSSDKDAATAFVPADAGKTPEEMFPVVEKLAADKTKEFKLVGADADGKVVIPGQGEYKVDADGVVTFTPEKGFVGVADPATVTLSVKNAEGAVTGTYAATYTPEVIPVKDPFANPDTAVAGENSKTFDVIGSTQKSSDKDAVVDGVPADEGKTPEEMFPALKGENKVFKLVGADAEGKVEIPGQGTYTVDDKGVVTFTPEKDFAGKATPVEILANDDNGQLYKAEYAPVVIPVIPSQSKTGVPGQPVTTDNPFKDIPGVDPESIGLIDPKDPTGDPKKELKIPGEGTWTVDPDGKVTFTPEDGFTKTPTPVNVGGKTKDGVPAKPGTVTIIPIADPFANPDKAVAGEDATTNGVINKSQRSSDKDPAVDGIPADAGKTPEEMFPALKGKNKVFKLVGADPKTGVLEVPGQGTYTVDGTGVVTFVPEKDFAGKATPVEILANDENGQLYKAKYSPVVIPEIPSQSKTGKPGQPVTTDKPFKDIPGVDPESIGFVDPKDPTGDPKKELKIPGEGVWTIDPEGNVTFTPEDGFTKTPTPVNVGGKTKDGIPAKPGTVTVTVTEEGNPGGSSEVPDWVKKVIPFTPLLLIPLLGGIAGSSGTPVVPGSS
ncbi:hypothetical protein NXS99_09140, partial [Corynebacterium sp. HS2168-gen11]|nr:hypothetical protein [Corynebacterium sp. HS2168-gen11]